MIKRGDKGTVMETGTKNNMPARIVADDLAGEASLGIAVTQYDGSEYLIKRMADGSSSCGNNPFIPSRPWDSLKPGDACFVRDSDTYAWYPRVFAGVSLDGKPRTFGEPSIYLWNYCVPAKLIDGELVPVEES